MSGASPSWRARWVLSAVLVGVSAAIAALAGEVLVRLLGSYDQAGVFHFRKRPIRPYAIPVSRANALISEYQRDSSSYMLFDSELGWTNRPGSCSRDRLYCANSQGLRANREYAPVPEGGVVRIALFGDSFIHGDDVPLAESMAPQLERALASREIRAEVLNYGVGGYGIDQAYLRYLRDARAHRIDIVVVGLQLENVARAVNLFRLLYYRGSGVPFSKPRFKRSGEQLVLINRPTVPVDRIVERLTNFDTDPLRSFERFYGLDYERRWYHVSKLASVAVDLIVNRWRVHENELYDPNGEAAVLTMITLDRFRRDVVSQGQRFEIIHLPTRLQITAAISGSPSVMDPLYETMARRYKLVDPSSALVARVRQVGVERIAPAHYSGEGNRIAAGALARALGDEHEAKMLVRQTGER